MKKVKLYTMSTCPWCRKARQFFKDRNITFAHVDYDLAPEAEQGRIEAEINGYGQRTAFPVVVIGDEIVVGYNPKRYRELLGLK